MKVKIKLLSDTIFGSGQSIPGGEDIAVLHDKNGFPYLRATTFKGIFREEFENYCSLTNERSDADIEKMFGKPGIANEDTDKIEKLNSERLIFTDFRISENVRNIILNDIGERSQNKVLDSFTNIYTFTSIENGVSKEGSLRSARCIKKGVIFYGIIGCSKENEDIIKNVLKMIKFMGNMKTRGFGRVKVEVVSGIDYIY